MGLMRFIATPVQRLDEEIASLAYLAGIDRAPWRLKTTLVESELTLQRSVGDSCNLFIPWDVPGFGRITLSTGSLLERPKPYQLPLELARGTVCLVRNQLADWEAIGLAVSKEIRESVALAVGQMAQAASRQDDLAASAEYAEKAICTALEATNQLAATYTDQALVARRRGTGKLASLLGANLGCTLVDEPTARQMLTAFNAVTIPFCWRTIEATEGKCCWEICDSQIEWCRSHRLRVLGGPLLNLDPRSLPDWLCLWEDDFESIESFVIEFISATVKRYRGRVAIWQAAGHLITGDVLSLSEEDRLRLAARVIETIHSLDPKTPVVVSFDEPWGEYLSRRDVGVPPLHFADALVRAGMDVSAITLEVNLGYDPDGTQPRSPVEFGRQLDYWGMLGLPLLVSITVPSSSQADPLAMGDSRVMRGSWTLRNQQAWAARYVPLLLAKPMVQGVIWNQLLDGQPHRLPHGGLFDATGKPKPVVNTLATIRQAVLK